METIQRQCKELVRLQKSHDSRWKNISKKLPLFVMNPRRVESWDEAAPGIVKATTWSTILLQAGSGACQFLSPIGVLGFTSLVGYLSNPLTNRRLYKYMVQGTSLLIECYYSWCVKKISNIDDCYFGESDQLEVERLVAKQKVIDVLRDKFSSTLPESIRECDISAKIYLSLRGHLKKKIKLEPATHSLLFEILGDKGREVADSYEKYKETGENSPQVEKAYNLLAVPFG